MRSLKAIACVLSLVIFLAGCAPRRGVYHTVRKGETLWRISYKYGVDIEDLAEINSIKDPSRIKAGQRIYIPRTKKVKESKKRYHTKRTTKKKTAQKSPAAAKKVKLVWPVKGRVVSGYGMRGDTMHKGIDIKAKEGTPIRAADHGKVVYADDGMRGYGNVIIIKHRNNLFTVYAHNRKNLVRKGDDVKKGQIIGYVGNTGNATTSHLHFEVRDGSKAINPFFFLP